MVAKVAAIFVGLALGIALRRLWVERSDSPEPGDPWLAREG